MHLACSERKNLIDRYEGLIKELEKENDPIINLIIDEYRKVEQTIEGYLPADPNSARPLYCRLFTLRDFMVTIFYRPQVDWWAEYRHAVQAAMGK